MMNSGFTRHPGALPQEVTGAGNLAHAPQAQVKGISKVLQFPIVRGGVLLERNPIIVQLKNLKNRMDTIFQENFGMGDHAEPADPSEPSEPQDSPKWTPHVDILEGGKEWLLIADLPGVREEDVQVVVLENQIVISGSRRALPPHGERKTFRAERPEGAFLRTFRLTPTAGPDNISARLSRGVLTVTIPKGEASSQPHKISILHE